LDCCLTLYGKPNLKLLLTLHQSRRMSTDLSTFLLLSGRNRPQTLLTRPQRERQLTSPDANFAHHAQADQLTLYQVIASDDT